MRRFILWGIAAGLVLFALVTAVGVRLGVLADATPRPEGPWLWIASRAAGITAFAALTLDTLFGLLASTGALDRAVSRARSVEVHRWLATVSLSLTVAHVVALLGDRYVRFDALAALVPLLSPYRPEAVALGSFAAYGGALVTASFALKSVIGARAWRLLHALSFAVFASALAHGVLAGSDSGDPAMRAFYLISGASVVALVAYRVVALAFRAVSPARPRSSGGIV